MKYSKDILETAVKSNDNFADMLKSIGLNTKPSNYRTLKRALNKFNIDYSHFKKHKSAKFITKTPKTFSETLVYGKEVHSVRLRKCMIGLGIEYKCFCCGILSLWNNKSLTLQIDHIDGDRLNNRLENLRFLCPNCHSQTESFCKKKNGGKQCKYCQVAIKHPRVLCEFCRKNNVHKTSKIKWPSDEDLQKAVFEKPNYQIAKTLGVSDTLLIKYCKKRGIKRPPRGYFLKNNLAN